MGINTADLTHDVRQAEMPQNSKGYKIGNWAANHFSGIKSDIRPVLAMAHAAHAVLGSTVMSNVTGAIHHLGLPLWTPSMPKPYKIDKKVYQKVKENKKSNKVVYFPSCINQTMGLADKSPVEQALVEKMVALLQKGNYEIIFPKGMDKLCCGTIWESKGMPEIADHKAAELEAALWDASEHGKYPVLCDQSPCLHRMRNTIKKMKLYEPVEFIYTFLRDKLDFTPIQNPIAIHITCSMRRMGLDKMFIELAGMCSMNVVVPEEVGCCGFAGDRGFTHPEVNAFALRKLKPQIEKAGIGIGYSNSRTCEIGLTTNAGIPYVSIAYLVDQCTQPKEQH